jgi:hypothetical protein
MHALLRAGLVAGLADVDVGKIGGIARPESRLWHVKCKRRAIGLSLCALIGHPSHSPMPARRDKASAIIADMCIFISTPKAGQGGRTDQR